jgi:hypothetical protein
MSFINIEIEPHIEIEPPIVRGYGSAEHFTIRVQVHDETSLSDATIVVELPALSSRNWF